MTYEDAKNQFEQERRAEDGYKVMEKITSIINTIGRDFVSLNGGELSEHRTKLAGYKFYLSDYIHELNRISKSIGIDIKAMKSSEFDKISARIKERDGKVKNRDQVLNEFEQDTKDMQYEQMLYETMYNKYKLKLAAVDDVLMAITQRIKELQDECRQRQ